MIHFWSPQGKSIMYCKYFSTTGSKEQNSKLCYSSFYHWKLCVYSDRSLDFCRLVYFSTFLKKKISMMFDNMPLCPCSTLAYCWHWPECVQDESTLMLSPVYQHDDCKSSCKVLFPASTSTSALWMVLYLSTTQVSVCQLCTWNSWLTIISAGGEVAITRTRREYIK